MFEIRRHQSGPRLYWFGRRLHHGTTGAILTAIGTAFMVHDRRDWRNWFTIAVENPNDPHIGGPSRR